MVATDDTFHRLASNPPELRLQNTPWVGKCVHCNTNLMVRSTGETNATLEHIVPMCAGGSPDDPRNLALACQACNNRKGIEHDQHVGKGGRADEVIESLRAKRAARWREPVQVQG